MCSINNATVVSVSHERSVQLRIGVLCQCLHVVVVLDQTLPLGAEQILDTLVMGVCRTVIGDLWIGHSHFVQVELGDFLNNFGVIVQFKF